MFFQDVQVLVFAPVIWLMIYLLLSNLKRRKRALDISALEYKKTRVSLIVPCKNVEENLRDNLVSFAQQEYPNYEVYYVTATVDDKAIPYIKEVTSNYSHCKHLIAGIDRNFSEKIYNVLSATEICSMDCDILAFADSDIVSNKQWLTNLIYPILRNQGKIGATTGYRWIYSDKTSFPTMIASVWNAFGLLFMAIPGLRFIWGGTYAITKKNFEKLNISDIWKNVVTEDFTLTTAIYNAKLKINFVSECISFSKTDYSYKSLIEWTTRQLTLCRFYYKRIYISTFLMTLTTLMNLYLAPISFVILYSVIGIIIFLRFKTIIKSVGNIKATVTTGVFLPIAGLLLILNQILSMFKSKIVWRGVVYHIHNSKKMEIVTLTE